MSSTTPPSERRPRGEIVASGAFARRSRRAAEGEGCRGARVKVALGYGFEGEGGGDKEVGCRGAAADAGGGGGLV
jgi:hypothetical protein